MYLQLNIKVDYVIVTFSYITFDCSSNEFQLVFRGIILDVNAHYCIGRYKASFVDVSGWTDEYQYICCGVL